MGIIAFGMVCYLLKATSVTLPGTVCASPDLKSTCVLWAVGLGDSYARTRSLAIYYSLIYVTVAEKTDHLAQVSDIEILVPRCSTLCTLCNGEVRITIAYTVLE